VTTAKIADGNVTLAKLADAAIVTEAEGISSNDNDTTIPTSAAVLDHVAKLPFSDYVESSPLNINTNGDTTFNHGFGETPKFFGAKIICTTANNGYSIDDELVIDGGYFSSEGSMGVFANGTVIGVTMGTNPRIPARGGGSGTHPALNTSQWDIVLWGAL